MNVAVIPSLPGASRWCFRRASTPLSNFLLLPLSFSLSLPFRFSLLTSPHFSLFSTKRYAPSPSTITASSHSLPPLSPPHRSRTDPPSTPLPPPLLPTFPRPPPFLRLRMSSSDRPITVADVLADAASSNPKPGTLAFVDFINRTIGPLLGGSGDSSGEHQTLCAFPPRETVN
jgi:hypothetical protein